MLNQTNPEIQTNLIISTGHITLKDSNILEEMSKDSTNLLLLTTLHGGYGFSIYAAGEEREDLRHLLEEEDNEGLSDNFYKLLNWAKNLNCTHLIIDADGPTYNGLEIFDW